MGRDRLGKGVGGLNLGWARLGIGIGPGLGKGWVGPNMGQDRLREWGLLTTNYYLYQLLTY